MFLLWQKFSIVCGEPAILLLSYTVPLVQWSTCLLLIMRDPCSIPGGYICETGILLLALSRYFVNPYVIDHCAHCGLVWGGLCPKPSPGHCVDNVIIPLDLTQLFGPSFMLAAGPPSSFTTDIVGCWGEYCGKPAISLHSYTVPLVQWSTSLLFVTRDPGSISREVLMWNRDSSVSLVSLHVNYSIVKGTNDQYASSWNVNKTTSRRRLILLDEKNWLVHLYYSWLVYFFHWQGSISAATGVSQILGGAGLRAEEEEASGHLSKEERLIPQELHQRVAWADPHWSWGSRRSHAVQNLGWSPTLHKDWCKQMWEAGHGSLFSHTCERCIAEPLEFYPGWSECPISCHVAAVAQGVEDQIHWLAPAAAAFH
jgi:hypothetical protein